MLSGARGPNLPAQASEPCWPEVKAWASDGVGSGLKRTVRVAELFWGRRQTA